MDRSTLDDDFSSYVDARRRELVRALVLVGCSPHEAEDQVQIALVRCYRAWPRVRAAADPDAYVYKVLFNSLKDSRARRWWNEQPTEVLPDRLGPGGDLADDASTGLAVRSALAGMSRPHRTVLVLRFLADLSERQVAEVLGIPAGTVKSRTSRALAELASDPALSQVYREGSH
jgi:RNA polymerase sigma-70 factor (sigma-E family)